MNRRTNRRADGGSPTQDPARDEPEPAARLQALTARELEVLGLLSTGASAKAIADRLGITRPTVKRHLTNLYRKLGVTNRVEAARCYLLAELDPSAPDSSERQRPDR
jgi:DNA-binding CsgD family transcriptional regulator